MQRKNSSSYRYRETRCQYCRPKCLVSWSFLVTYLRLCPSVKKENPSFYCPMRCFHSLFLTNPCEDERITSYRPPGRLFFVCPGQWPWNIVVSKGRSRRLEGKVSSLQCPRAIRTWSTMGHSRVFLLVSLAMQPHLYSFSTVDSISMHLPFQPDAAGIVHDVPYHPSCMMESMVRSGCLCIFLAEYPPLFFPDARMYMRV
jgi:hypothetical protein